MRWRDKLVCGFQYRYYFPSPLTPFGAVFRSKHKAAIVLLIAIFGSIDLSKLVGDTSAPLFVH